MEYGAVLHSPYYTLPEGMKFTLVVFSCKQYVDMVARACVYIIAEREARQLIVQCGGRI